MDEAVELITAWCRQQPLDGVEVEVVRLPGRTPLILMEMPGASEQRVLIYGHYDKQPEMTGWRDDLGPWTPVLEGPRLYGRGGADDGYAAFASVAALLALQDQNIPHAHCFILIEGCEESGSFDLPYYMDALAQRIGSPSLVVCLDSGCGNYEQLWCTTSLRGLLVGTLSVEVMTEGVHSGDASGIVPSSFRILRQLLSRVEDESTGAVIPVEFHAEIPADRLDQASRAAQVLGEEVYQRFPFHDGTQPLSSSPTDLVLNRTWRPALSITGAAGLPPLQEAGNVMHSKTAVKLSLRLAPTCDADIAMSHMKSLLWTEPPYGARVTFEDEAVASGWNAPPLSARLKKSIDEGSRTYFGKEAVYMGESSSIPFMDMLGKRFPHAQFLITGVLGPHSNAHGPNEFLHIPTGKNVTCCVAHVLREHYGVLGQ